MDRVAVEIDRSHVAARLRIYVPVAVIAVTIAIVGFWRSYFGPLVSGTLDTVPMIHVHAAVFVGWLVLVVAQATLAATGRKALHIRLGNVGMIYGALLIVVGVATALDQFGMRIDAGQIQEAQNRLFVPLTDLMVFTPFLAAAWIYRRRPEVHKRLIIVASTILLIAAVHRMTFLGGRPPPVSRLLLVWLSPIYLGMLYDLFKHRIVHPVYLIGIAAILYLKFGRMPFYNSEAWKSFASWMTALYV